MPQGDHAARRADVATDVIMPALGVAQDTGRVVRWLCAEGDAGAQGPAADA